MLDKNTIIRVSNRDGGSVGYSIPEMNITRNFQKGETKEVTMGELRQLSYIPGGQVVINECLIVHSPEALAELHPDYEPEYFYTEEDIKNLLLNGSIEQFLDCLDFAPEGVLSLIKDLAVKLEVNDLAKRNAIFNKLGFNVTKAIEINHESDIVNEEEVKVRRTAPITAAAATTQTSARRTTVPVPEAKIPEVTLPEINVPEAPKPVASRYNVVKK